MAIFDETFMMPPTQISWRARSSGDRQHLPEHSQEKRPIEKNVPEPSCWRDQARFTHMQGMWGCCSHRGETVILTIHSMTHSSKPWVCNTPRNERLSTT